MVLLACEYINLETWNKTNEACSIVIGVNTFDDMRKAKVVSISNKAKEMGVEIAGTGDIALKKIR